MDFFELKKMVDCGLPPSDLIVPILKALIFPCHYKKRSIYEGKFLWAWWAKSNIGKSRAKQTKPGYVCS